MRKCMQWVNAFIPYGIPDAIAGAANWRDTPSPSWWLQAPAVTSGSGTLRATQSGRRLGAGLRSAPFAPFELKGVSKPCQSSRIIQLALYHNLGDLTEPNFTHRFRGTFRMERITSMLIERTPLRTRIPVASRGCPEEDAPCREGNAQVAAQSTPRPGCAHCLRQYVLF